MNISIRVTIIACLTVCTGIASSQPLSPNNNNNKLIIRIINNTTEYKTYCSIDTGVYHYPKHLNRQLRKLTHNKKLINRVCQKLNPYAPCESPLGLMTNMRGMKNYLGNKAVRTIVNCRQFMSTRGYLNSLLTDYIQIGKKAKHGQNNQHIRMN